MIYHGVKEFRGRNIYSAGSFLLDKKNPEKVLARTPEKSAFIKPTNDYEKKGFMRGVVFPTGVIKSLDGKDLIIYSGEADSNISVRQIPIKEFLNHMEYY